MRLPPHLLMVVAVTSAPFAASPLAGQARIDEGTFVFLKGGTPARTETFRISRNRNVITATAQISAGTQQIVSSLATDTLGTPAQFDWAIFNFADTYLVTGAIMLVIQALFLQPAEETVTAATPAVGTPATTPRA